MAVHTELDRRIADRYKTKIDVYWERSNVSRIGEDVRARLLNEATAEVTREMERAQIAEFDATTKPLLSGLAAGNCDAMTAFVEAVAKRHGFTCIWQQAKLFEGTGSAAWADWGARTIRVPIIAGAEDFAVALHEAGHIVAGACTRQPPHFAQPEEKRWHKCLECEAEAWRIALEQLSPTSALEAVHARLRRSLEIYTDSTPGTHPAFDKIKRLRSGLALRTVQHRHRLGLDWYRLRLHGGQAACANGQ